ncbi:MAG: FecR family protein [Elusimicrobiota bacterium]
MSGKPHKNLDVWKISIRFIEQICAFRLTFLSLLTTYAFRLTLLFLLTTCAFRLTSLQAAPKPKAGSISAVVTTVMGKMEVRRSGTKKWEKARSGMFLFAGDEVRTASGAKGAIVFSNGSEMKINSSSHFTIESEDRIKREGKVHLHRGQTYNRSVTLRAKISVRTPVAVVSVRGTEYDTQVDEDGDTDVLVVDGEVSVTNDFGSVNVEEGQSTTVTAGQSPTTPQDVSITEMTQATEWQQEIKIDRKKLKIKYKTQDGKEGTLRLQFSK